MSVIAVTGGTGFLGSHFVELALGQGHQLRALTRRPQPERDGINWIEGALDRPDSLAALVAGADAVLHIAGVINAPDQAGFAAGNIEGTRAMIAATQSAGIRRFVQISSLTAREPDLSHYGWSKAEADKLLMASELDWTIVRPPAMFGPRDQEMLELFRLARHHVMPLPPAGGRMSVIAADDLVRLLLLLATADHLRREIVEPDDGTPNGWDHRDFARAIGKAVGTKVLPLTGFVISAIPTGSVMPARP
jgi:uncharacterized protein YbjT (DUF2867 family)